MRLAWESIRADRVLRLALIGQVFVWTIATLVPPVVLAYDATHLGLKDWQSGLPLAALGIGVGLGCLLAGKLSASKVEYGLLPLGALGLTISALAFAAIGPGLYGTIVRDDVSGDLQRFALRSAQCALAMAVAGRPPGSGDRHGERSGLWRNGPGHLPGLGAGTRPASRVEARSWRHRSSWRAVLCGRCRWCPKLSCGSS